MPIITTAQMSITDPDALDITVKSASTPEGRALAPTWPMVNASTAIPEAGFTPHGAIGCDEITGLNRSWRWMPVHRDP